MQDLKDISKVLFWVFLPFAFVPLVASCQEKANSRMISECQAKGGQYILSPRNVVTGCVL